MDQKINGNVFDINHLICISLLCYHHSVYSDIIMLATGHKGDIGLKSWQNMCTYQNQDYLEKCNVE